MKIFNLKGFKNLPLINGIKQCPSGDYSAIKNFGEWCSFSYGCRFGEQCSFGEKCSFENGNIAKTGYPLLTFGGFGTLNRTTYFFNCEDGIFVRCGCFSGNINNFREQVKLTREGKIAEEYFAIADLVERKWGK